MSTTTTTKKRRVQLPDRQPSNDTLKVHVNNSLQHKRSIYDIRDRYMAKDIDVDVAIRELNAVMMQMAGNMKPFMARQDMIELAVPEFSEEELLIGFDKAAAIVRYLIKHRYDSVGLGWLSMFYCLAVSGQIGFLSAE